MFAAKAGSADAAGQRGFPMDANEISVEQRRKALVDAFLNDRGLLHLTESAAEILGNPVLVVDPTYHNAARAGFVLDESDDSAFAQTTRAELARDDTIIEEGVRYILEEGIDEELARAKSPVVRLNAVYGLKTMTSTIMVHGTCLGRAMMIEHDRPFTETDAELFTLFVRLVAQELQKAGFLTLGGPQQGPYFLGRLLDDEHPNPISCARRMRLVGFSPLSDLFVVCIRSPHRALDPRSAEGIRGQLQAMLHHSLITLYEGELVALVSRADAPRLPESDEKTLARAALSNGLVVGVSNVFREVTDVRPHLAQARAAVRYGSTYTKIMDDTHVYRYCEYTYMEMLDICNDHINLMNYVHPAIWDLWQHDQEHESELVETLFAFMQNGCNTAKTASLLSLHKNTLLYRLNRIKDVTNNDLRSGEDLFLFHLSIRVLIYLRIFEPRTKPRTSQDLHSLK